MNKYEMMFIVKPDLEESVTKGVSEDMKKLVETKGAKVIELKDMGQRELAYKINNYQNGHYFLITIETENDEAVKEFDRVALINENIIRHLIVKVDE